MIKFSLHKVSNLEENSQFSHRTQISDHSISMPIEDWIVLVVCQVDIESFSEGIPVGATAHVPMEGCVNLHTL